MRQVGNRLDKTEATALDKVKAVKNMVRGFNNVGRYCSKKLMKLS